MPLFQQWKSKAKKYRSLFLCSAASTSWFKCAFSMHQRSTISLCHEPLRPCLYQPTCHSVTVKNHLTGQAWWILIRVVEGKLTQHIYCCTMSQSALSKNWKFNNFSSNTCINIRIKIWTMCECWRINIISCQRRQYE